MAFMQATVPYTAVALTASTAETVVGLKAATNVVVKILDSSVSFNGANSGNAPVTADLHARCSFATNGPGTNSTSVTPFKMDTARAETIQMTAAATWTTEPTSYTTNVLRSLYVGQFNGLLDYVNPWAAPCIVVGGYGFTQRLNSPNNVSATGHILCEE